MATIGTCWASGTWATPAWASGTWEAQSTTPLVLNDLSTELVAHLDTLYAATPTDDYSTLLMRDIPTMRADADSEEKDVNTDYAKYLS